MLRLKDMGAKRPPCLGDLGARLASVPPLSSRRVLLPAEPTLIGELKQVGKPSEKDQVQKRSQVPGGVVPITAGSFARICIM